MNTKEIISADEAQALREGAGNVDPQGPAPEGHVLDLHADHWERIAADRAPALDAISERMGSLLKMTARRFFRRPVDVTPRGWRDERWGAYARRLPVPSSLNVLEIRTQKLKGMITLDADFVFTLTDIFFGGDGKSTRADGTPDFTPMEIRLARKFVTAVIQDIKEAWKPYGAVDIQLGNSEISPVFAALAANSESVSITGFELMLGSQELKFELVLPQAFIEPLRRLRNPGQPNQGDADSSQRWQARLKTDVQDATVSLRAVVNGTQVILRDISQARPGDIIAIDAPTTITLYAGENALLEGTLGACQGRNAVRITKPANRNTVGEKYGRGENI
jgi:flagellar motor switch protein FliM